jgi:hypothetical protein
MLKNSAILFILLALVPLVTAAQEPPKPSEPIQKLADNVYRLGKIHIDTAKKEVTVSGTVNSVRVLEFIANTRGGMKAYESALTLDTDGIDFNTALLLIGFDVTHSRQPRRHFDPTTPEGDRASLTLEWKRGSETRRSPVEELLYDDVTHQPAPLGAWVYTGSAILANGRYLANVDGVLIGFVHSPAPIIEQVEGVGVSRYGQIIMNPNIGLDPETPIILTVKYLGPAAKPQ